MHATLQAAGQSVLVLFYCIVFLSPRLASCPPAGVLQAPSSWESVPELLRRQRRKEAAMHAIPPITQLPPPVSPYAGPLPEVELNVDYERDIQPYLGRCLVCGARLG